LASHAGVILSNTEHLSDDSTFQLIREGKVFDAPSR